MPPRKRNPENRGLPSRWRYTHGAYYYQVPPGMEDHWDGKKMFRLGKTLPEAYRTWAERIDLSSSARTIGDLLERYANEVIPTKAKSTHADQLRSCKRLMAVFGAMAIESLKPVHVYQYLDRRGRTARTSANREVALLSHAYTKAIEWGLTETHPIKGKVRKLGTPPRTRYVEDWEIIEALSLPARQSRGSVRMLQAYIKLKLLTGLRRADLLRITVHDLKEDGIHVTPGKTAGSSGKRIIYQWTDELRDVIEECKAVRPVHISKFIFCNRRGQCYIGANGRASSFDSLWQRFMSRLLAETKITERFTEHDLRAKAGSDAESADRARQLLAHSSADLTRKVYRRKPEVVTPAAGISGKKTQDE